MRYIKYITIIFLISGCELKTKNSHDKQYFLCEGYVHSVRTTPNGQKFPSTYKTSDNLIIDKFKKTYDSRKNLEGEKPYKVTILGTLQISDPQIGSKTYEICAEDVDAIFFRPTCDFSSYTETINPSESHHQGVINKFNGKLSYEERYLTDGRLFEKRISLVCKKIDAPVVK